MYPEEDLYPDEQNPEENPFERTDGGPGDAYPDEYPEDPLPPADEYPQEPAPQEPAPAAGNANLECFSFTCQFEFNGHQPSSPLFHATVHVGSASRAQLRLRGQHAPHGRQRALPPRLRQVPQLRHRHPRRRFHPVSPHTEKLLRATGLSDNDSAGYMATYLKPGSTAILHSRSNVTMAQDRIVRLRYYEAVSGHRFSACCGTEAFCPFNSDEGVAVYSYRQWQTAEFVCPKGTDKVPPPSPPCPALPASNPTGPSS